MSVLFKEALNLALKSCETVKETETVELWNALGRVLAEDVVSVKNLPAFNNSAMDGYAFKYEEINFPLKIVKTVFAGDLAEAVLKKGECYKIMTGAKLPSDADTVAQKEICEVNDGYVKIVQNIKKGNAVRLKGEEQKKGTVLLKKGELLTPDRIGLLASQGVFKIEVFKKLKIAVLSTGSELKEPWEEAKEDEIYNINGINIVMLLKNFRFPADYLGALPDSLEQTVEKIAALKDYDLIITSGGISTGDADFVKTAFLKNGLKELFHGVKVKPGHPTMMGIMGKTFVMAMPGNPLAAILNIMFLSMPVILKMQGAENFEFKKITAKNAEELKLKPGRVNIILGNIKDGRFYAYNRGKYGSGMVTPLVNSSYAVLFDEKQSLIKEGEEIKAIRLYCL